MSKGGWDDWSDIGRMCAMLAYGAIGCALIILGIIAGLLIWIWNLL